jgi:hypothetical protein
VVSRRQLSINISLRVANFGVRRRMNRGASQQMFSLRVSKSFTLFGNARLEAIGEVFNLFNALNPATFTGRRFIWTTGAPDPNFLRPTEFSGDFQNPEQRVGQIGFRFTF